MLPFHKGDRITTTAGAATLLGFSATVKGSMVEAPEAPRRKGGHLPYAQLVTDSGRFGATRYAALRPEELPGHQLRAGDVIRLSEWSTDEPHLRKKWAGEARKLLNMRADFQGPHATARNRGIHDVISLLEGAGE